MLNRYLPILNQYVYDYSLFNWSFSNAKLILKGFLSQINIYQYLTATCQYLFNTCKAVFKGNI